MSCIKIDKPLVTSIASYHFSPARLINSIKDKYSCKILYLLSLFSFQPEVEPPKPLKVVPVKFTDGPLNDSVLRYLAGELGKEWKDVAAHLNLRPMRIQAILRQNVNKDTTNTRYDMLVSWAKRIPKSVDKVNEIFDIQLR